MSGPGHAMRRASQAQTDKAIIKIVSKKLTRAVTKQLAPEEIELWDKTHVSLRLMTFKSIRGGAKPTYKSLKRGGGDDMSPEDRLVAAIKLTYSVRRRPQ